MKIIFSPDGDYVITIYKNGNVHAAYYQPGGAESEYERAIGYTNEEPDGTQRLLLELDDHTIDADDIACALDNLGLSFFMIVKTHSGWHAVTRFRGTGREVAETAMQLAEWGLCDKGYAELTKTRAERNMAFTQILRVWGKHREPDIVVKRWTPPVSKWEASVMRLYAFWAQFEVSATRLAHNCPSYVAAIPKELIERGLKVHRETEAWLQDLGAVVEVPLTMKIGHVTLTGKVDAVMDDGREAYIFEIKSSPESANDPVAHQQAAIYAAMYAELHRVIATPAVMYGKKIVWEGEPEVPGDAVWKLVHRLGKAWSARDAKCDRCALKECAWRKRY